MATDQRDATSDVAAITSHALRLGYRATKLGFNLLEGGLRQGLGADDRFEDSRRGVKDPSPDINALAQQIGQLAGQLSTASLKFLLAVLQDLKPGGAPWPIPPYGQAEVECEVNGNNNATAKDFYITQPKDPKKLFVNGLYSSASKKPITDIKFTVTVDGHHFRAVITVPERQPAGVYSGLVFGGADEKSLGTMTVEIRKGTTTPRSDARPVVRREFAG